MDDGDAPKTLKVSVGSTEIPMSFYEAQATLEGLVVRQWTKVVVEPPPGKRAWPAFSRYGKDHHRTTGGGVGWTECTPEYPHWSLDNLRAV